MEEPSTLIRFTPDDVRAVWFAIEIRAAIKAGELPLIEAISNFQVERLTEDPEYWVWPPPGINSPVYYNSSWSPPEPSLDLYRRGEELLTEDVELVRREHPWTDAADPAALWTRQFLVVESPIVAWQTGWSYPDPVYTLFALRSRRLVPDYLSALRHVQEVQSYEESDRVVYGAHWMETVGHVMAELERPHPVCTDEERLEVVERVAAHTSSELGVTVYVTETTIWSRYLAGKKIAETRHTRLTGIEYHSGERWEDEDAIWS